MSKKAWISGIAGLAIIFGAAPFSYAKEEPAIDCDVLCPRLPESCVKPESDAASQTGASGDKPLEVACVASASITLTDGLSQLLRPPMTPESVHVLRDHGGNLIFSMLAADAQNTQKEIYYAVLKPNGTVVGWQPLGRGNAVDEYAISTSATNYLIHVVARVGTTLKHCKFEVGKTCMATMWSPITFDNVEVLGARNMIAGFKGGSLNLFEVPEMGVGLGFLGIPHTQGAANPPSAADGYWILETVYVERGGTLRWQPQLGAPHGQSFVNDLKMTHFPTQGDMTEAGHNDLPDNIFLVAVWEDSNQHMHYDWNRQWRFTTYNNGASGAWRTTYAPAGTLTSLSKGSEHDDQTKSIADVIYQRGFPGFDIFAINTADKLLHVWKRSRNGTGGAAIETEEDITVNKVSAVYSRSLDKIVVIAIEKEGATAFSLAYKAIGGHPEAAHGANKLSGVNWQILTGQFSLLDIVDTPQGVVGITYDMSSGIKFLVCDSDTHCGLVE